MPLGELNLAELAERTHGFVGADIKALCQEAGYAALRRILPGLEDTEQKLSDDFIQAITVEAEDFEAALKEMRPSSGRNFEVDLRGCGWDYVAGYSAEIDFLKDMVLWPLQNSLFLSRIGATNSGGLLVTGPSGVGKTLIARSLAKESGFNVIEIRGPELISKYVGESERNIRQLFRQARQMAPTVVIFDGIDAIVSSGWTDSKVMDRLVNQLVMEMNSLGEDKPILVIAVTNRADNLPPALRATGRFSNELPLRLPDLDDRSQIFKMYLTKPQVKFVGDLRAVASDAEGLSGADIAEISRRVILQAARCVIDPDLSSECGVTILEDDVLKMLDRWRLISGLRLEA